MYISEYVLRYTPKHLSRTLPIALDGTLPAYLTVHSEVSSQDALKHIPEHALKYTPNCTRLHTPSLLDYMSPSTLSRRSQVHSEYASKYTSQYILMYTPGHALKDLPVPLDSTLPACLTIRSQVSPRDAPKCTPSMLPSTPSTFWRTLLGMLSRTLPIALDGTLPAWLTVRSQVSSQDALEHTPENALKYTPNRTRWHSQPISLYAPKYTLKRQDTPKLTWLYAPMYAPTCSIQRLAQLQTPGTGRREAGGGWRAVFGGWRVACGVWRVACGVWRVACGVWRVAYIGRNHDVGRYGSLNLIFSAATMTTSHDASRFWCSQL